MEATVVTQEELALIQKMQSEFTQAKITLGDIELQKQGIIRGVEMLKAEFGANEKKLIEKYGENAIINVQTGAITYKEK